MSDEILRFENVWYGNDIVRDHVDNISFSLARGEGLVIAGPEGSGKSQIMGLIMAKYLPRAGQIFHDKINLRLQQEEEIERLRFSIGYVTQTAGLINNLSVLENIILPLRYHTDMKDDALFAAAEFWIDRYELSHKIRARPVALSPSETIRTALIRALIVEPRVLLLDMVFDGLCPLASRRILELVFEDIQARQIAHIISTYYPRVFEARDLKFMLLYRGEVVFDGKIADLNIADNVFLDQYRNFATKGAMRAFNEAI